MDDIDPVIDEIIEDLRHINAEIVKRQTSLERDLSAVGQAFSGQRSDQVQEFIELIAKTRDLYSEAGETAWSAKEALEELKQQL